jgi:hypothetical protein
MLATIKLAILSMKYCPESGDFVETGVFTGGSTSLLMRALLDFDGCGRKLYAFDSFIGLPNVTAEDLKGRGIVGRQGLFNVSEVQFESNLRATNAWNDTVIVVTKGWFNETCPASPVKNIAFLRLDGDLFSSTWDAISALYRKVEPGGIIYVDDYGSFNGCRKAIDMFRTKHRIFEPIHFIQEPSTDNKKRTTFEAIWWQKRGSAEILSTATV